jgi:hypothetical protein
MEGFPSEMGETVLQPPLGLGWQMDTVRDPSPLFHLS